jgi:hypothetical protein
MRRTLALLAVVAILAAWAGEAHAEYRYNEDALDGHRTIDVLSASISKG